MIEINQQITFLPTQQLEKVEHFYSEQLQLKKALDQGDCIIFRVTEASYIGFCLRNQEIINPGVILTLVTDQVDEFFNNLTAKNVKIESAPRINEKYNIYHFFVKDPNGYLVEVQKFLDGFDGR